MPGVVGQKPRGEKRELPKSKLPHSALATKPRFSDAAGVSSHLYPHLMGRWKDLARRAGLKLRPLAHADGWRLSYLETASASVEEPLYISAGVHGDEPGGTEGLLAWAESEVKNLAKWPLLLFPCLNPWGLRNNVRTDASGVDLNRSFHLELPVVAAVKKVVGDRPVRLSVHLHEDYDGEGMYIYELSRREQWAEHLLAAARPWVPTDPRKKIDISRAQNGVVRRRITRKRFEKLGYPEPIWLYFGHTDHSFTIETPSEVALERRVAAHVAALQEITRRVFGGGARADASK